MRSTPLPLMPSLLLCGTLFAAGVVRADDDVPGMCAPAMQAPARIAEVWATPEDEAPAAQPPPVVAEATRAAIVRDGVSQLEGDVWLQQGDDFLSTEALEFDEDTGIVRTLAPARFGSRQLMVDAEAATYDTSLGEGVFEGVAFFMPERGGRGEAEQLARTGESTAVLEGVMFTTCPPDDEDWTLRASSLDLDQESGMGVGRNVRIAFMGVPFFYTPWISFPIDDRRKTGFLFPEFGDSSRTGAWLRTPYYINLAPNYDATLTPYYMADRGTMLESEFRYLFGWGAGELEADYLGTDRRTDTDRHYYQLRHLSRLPADWRMQVDYRQVSDEEYFQDFSGDGGATLVSHLAQQFLLGRSALEYGAQMQLLRYQTVDPTIPEANRPYEKWPDIDYYYAPLPFGDRLWVEVEGESVNFQRDDRVSGWRHHAVPALSVDLGDAGLRLTPRLAWWQTEYDLEQPDSTALKPGRGVPVGSLDLLARFARPLASGGQQTLEPRLFYLNVPYREQDDIPLFDTRETSDTLASLFQENRFTGPDRIGDTERVTFGLETSLLAPTGQEWFSAAIARAWYLEDRRVQMPGVTEPDTRPASNIYGRLEYVPAAGHDVRLDLSWNPDEDRTDFGSLQYQYRPAERSVLNVAYRYRRFPGSGAIALPLKQADISFAAPIGGAFRVFGRAVYSLEDERSQETLAGFEYENCCWVFRTFSRRFIFNRDGDFDRSIWFQLELKGLASVGRRIDEFLADDIHGYGETP